VTVEHDKRVRPLTPRQQRFVEEYVVDLNATQASIRAGYSPNGARVRGTQLLANSNIQDALGHAQEDRRLRVELEADDVVRQLAVVAFANITDFVSWDEVGVCLLPTEKIDQIKLTAVQSVTSGQHGVTIRLHDKLRALELLAKHLGMFREETRVELEIRDGSEILEQLTAKIESYAAR
jgi:phage terminase small subunit